MVEFESNGLPFEVLGESDVPIRSGLSLEICRWDDPQTIIDYLPNRREPTLLDEIGGNGGGSFRVSRNDPRLAAKPLLNHWRNVARLRLDGRVIGGFLMQNRSLKKVTAGEDSDTDYEWSGEGLRGWMRDAVVAPYGGVKPDSQPSRVFSFASEQGSWYMEEDWFPTINVHQYSLDPNPANVFGTAPAEWPDAPDAYWVWGDANGPADPAPAGLNFFRYEFDIPVSRGTQNYAVFASAKDDFDVYMDAGEIISVREDDAYAQTWRADFELSPGHHVLAIRVQNDGGNAGLIAAFYQAGDAELETAARLLAYTGQGSATSINSRLSTAVTARNAAQATYDSLPAGPEKDSALLVLQDRQGDVDRLTIVRNEVVYQEGQGNPGWVVNAYPDPAPGWTPGEILLTLLAEAEARGVRFPTFLTPTFTATADTDGLPWSRALDWSFDIGSDYLDVVEKLEELVCDVWIDASNYTLNAYAERGVRRDEQSQTAQPVQLQIARNVTEARQEATSDLKNALLTQSQDGYSFLADGEGISVAEYGRVEGYISTGASASVSSDVAQRMFELRANPQTSSTYRFIDVDAARPFFDFGAGDWILAPGEGTEPESIRLMSLSVAEDTSNGKPTYTAEIGTVFEEREARIERWLKTTSNGTLGGSLANSSGGGGGSASPNTQAVQRGPQGLQGAKGTPGEQGPQGEAYNYRGLWDSEADYALSDVVTWDNQQWLATSASNGSEPGTAEDDWTLLISDGTVVFKRVASLDETLYPVSQNAASTAITASGTTVTATVAAQVGDLLFAAVMHRSALTTPVGWTLLQTIGPIGSDSFSNRLSMLWKRANTDGDQAFVAVQASAARLLVTLQSIQNAGVPLVDLSANQLLADAPNPPAAALSFTKGEETRIWAALSNSADLTAWTGSSELQLVQSPVEPRLVSAFDSGEPGARSLTSPSSSPTVVLLSSVVLNPASQFAIWQGPPGQDGEDGTDGEDGAPGPPGAGAVYKGPWDIATEYVPNDLVAYADRLWATDETSTGAEPGVSSSWEPVTPAASGASRTIATFTTGSLAADATETGTVTLGSAYRLYRLETDEPARVRIYATAAQRTADAARPIGTDPEGDHGLIFEFVTTDTLLAAVLSPFVDGANMETTPTGAIPISVTNLSGATDTIQVSLTYISTEA